MACSLYVPRDDFIKAYRFDEIARETNSFLHSTVTCSERFNDFVPLPAIEYKIMFSVAVAGIGILTGEFTSDGSIRFHLPEIFIVVSKPVTQENVPSVCITGEAKVPNLEWRYLAQIRFRVGTTASEIDKVVDGDLFEIGNRYPPIAIQIGDKNIQRIRIEMKMVEKLHNYLPKFESGDIVLKFKTETLIVYKALLRMHSKYMATAEKLKFAEEGTVVYMGDSDANDFKELLYQIYPTKRPIFANLPALARAAVGYRAEGIIDRLTSFIVNYESMYMEQKISEAIKLEIPNIIEELVYRAEQDGLWVNIIRSGLNPEVEYGPTIYNSIILPAVSKAKISPLGTPFRKEFFQEINFRVPPKKDNYDDTVVLIVGGVKLYVHNDAMFGRTNSGFLLHHKIRQFLITQNFVRHALLRHIYPQNKPIEHDLLRPLLVFCKKHRMQYAMNSIEKKEEKIISKKTDTEAHQFIKHIISVLAMFSLYLQYLIQEPPSSPDNFFERFQLADKYGLRNLMLRNLYRIENSDKQSSCLYYSVTTCMWKILQQNFDGSINCRHFAQPMINNEGFKDLSESTKSRILDRYCSGWGVGGMNPTKRRSRIFTAGGAVNNAAFEEDKKLSTLLEIDSDAAFGTFIEIN
ncbi:unnamed protein product [Thelazia callipaeda]|uniref:BTB domain-containing protein n=1 Tax=Thelazia callipaeda TaxID=103827 RepID=A0A0N5D5H4_THECL|nr:unnamed protein product [Thelazia callipaeda]